MAYVLLLDEVERRALAMLTVAAVAAAGGVRVEYPDPATAREEFEAALYAEPVPADPDRKALIDALGLGGGR